MPIRSLSKELQEKAIAELNEVPGRIQEDLNHIREWVLKQPHLKARLDDQWLISFLRGTKYSLQRTKEKLDLYYTVRSVSPELFGKIRDPLSPEIQSYFNQQILAKLPNDSDSLAPQRFIIRGQSVDPNKVTVINCFKSVLMVIDSLLHTSDVCVVNGQELIIDLHGVHYNIVTQLTPTILKKCVIFGQDAYPTRIKGIYFLNVPPHLQFIFNIITPFMSAKIKKRVHLYTKNNIQDLYERIPRSVLPKEYGGYAGPFAKLADDMRLFIESQQEWLLEDSMYGCDETKRINKSKYSSEYFNMEGSFRKLEID